MDDSARRVEIERLEKGLYEAVNLRGGRLRFGTAEGADFSPVELLLAAIAGCTAIDVDFITSKRSEPERFSVTMTASKVRDSQGNRLEDLQVEFDLAFPEGEAGTAAREILPSAVQRSHERLCTVSRTVELGTPVDVRLR
ncbi:OsmC family protein [Nocardioides mesophilus]|uniref:OsmC family protein n=1 Tax=Nocardioides mesophilus TaxID=433659 RepID=A0A7G9RAT3_9ACTN|nr:OsmC family protein [Nocardioides mesophilus]QNN52708.1 OsmC family protein [Nocardioides mesophilus]